MAVDGLTTCVSPPLASLTSLSLSQVLVWTIEPNAKIIRQGGVAHTDMQATVMVKIEQLIKDYPALGSFIEAMAQKFSLQAKLVYQLNNGLILAEAKLVSTTYQSEVHFKTMEGKLLPYDQGGTSHPEATIDLASLQDLTATAVVEFSGEVLGLRFMAKDIRIKTDFHNGPIATLSAKLVAMPAPKIEGYALGFVPTWAISAAMPGGSLDSVTQELTQGLLTGSSGHGTFALAKIDSRSPGHSTADFTSSTELVDNFYLTFGVSVAEKYLWPSREVIASSWQLSQDLVRALEVDTARLGQLSQAQGRRPSAADCH